MAAAGEKFSVPDEGSGRACALLRGAAGGFLSEMCIFAAVNERLLQSFGFFFSHSRLNQLLSFVRNGVRYHVSSIPLSYEYEVETRVAGDYDRRDENGRVT